jgi:hypothetical protein
MPKQQTDPVPINFRLTANAANEISGRAKIASSEAGETLIPVIGWHEEYEEAQHRLVEYGIAATWSNGVGVPSGYIQNVDGITLIFNVRQNRAHKFEGRVIDYSNGQFVFLET